MVRFHLVNNGKPLTKQNKMIVFKKKKKNHKMKKRVFKSILIAMFMQIVQTTTL
jgi:hypothetical protein